MPVKVSREKFLHALESVEPGLSPRDIVDQANAFVFRNGRLYTYNDELACRIKSPLGKELEGAVRAEKLLELLRKLPEDEVTIDQRDGQLLVTGTGRRSGFVM